MNNGVHIKEKPHRQMSRFWKITLAILLGIILLVSAAAVWAYFQLTSGLPQVEGESEVSGLESEVDVYRDENGVPHIEAENDRDLYYAQGFVTAQDRMVQMDLSRRQASGTLSEVIGEDALDADRYFRTFGLRRAAEASMSAYSDEAFEVAEAYAEGVNDYISHMISENEMPVEFRLLGYEPEPWTVLDSLTIGKFMAYDLGGNWQGQAFRHWLTNNVSEEEAQDLMPTYPEDGPVILDVAKDTNVDIEEAFADVSEYLPEPFNGSNNWVISGDHTESGSPLLADDPHLSLDTPSIWYETHLKSPSVNVTGVIFAGVPGIILGHNADIAWGVTNVGPDVQQLYMERRHPEDPYQFLYEDEWYDAEVVEEEIEVDGYDEPFLHETIITRHGPLISEYAHEEGAAGDDALALKWTAHDPSPEFEALMGINRADDWESFTTALEDFHAPAQNFVFADTDGNIGYRANGKIPIRSDDEDALFPVPGWTGEHDWEGFIPWDELPTIENPESGMISTANNQIDDEEYEYHLTHTWAQPYRHERILQMLEGGDNFTAEDMKAMQMDVQNLQASEFVPLLMEGVADEELREIDEEALEVLSSWDERDIADESGPLIFHLWMSAIPQVLFADAIPESVLDIFEGQPGIVDQLLRDAADGNPGPWMEKNGGLSEVTTEALQRAVNYAVNHQGDTPENWLWGDYHRSTFAHPFGDVGPLGILFNASPEAVDGSSITVMAASYDEETGDTNHGAGWRGVMDLADLSESEHIVAPGQSGHVMSDHYHDQVPDWVEGDYHRTSIEPDDYQSESKHLQLVPKNNAD
ncbi:penicillin acylase family protein [Salicibibacter kimchii]|uniref:Penicillin acylase family protein n=1 Tax=Salicibibacter kimchii TaxID=2099786 RepID=A0A345C428_9BACI|nr:penicillin acylase family protein [Salicibibacter kimchii]AXF57959.1 penicillin acylase family protein [Salicibibacter kimchii]